MRLTTNALWKIPLGGKRLLQTELFYIDSEQGFLVKGRTPETSETFHVVFKTTKLPIFLTERERGKKGLTKWNWKRGQRLVKVGATVTNPQALIKQKRNFPISCVQGCAENRLCRERGECDLIVLPRSCSR